MCQQQPAALYALLRFHPPSALLLTKGPLVTCALSFTKYPSCGLTRWCTLLHLLVQMLEAAALWLDNIEVATLCLDNIEAATLCLDIDVQQAKKTGNKINAAGLWQPAFCSL